MNKDLCYEVGTSTYRYLAIGLENTKEHLTVVGNLMLCSSLVLL